MNKNDVDHIEIRGARVHNLKNIDLDLPLGKLICFAGPSGSGKTSLAFHTLLTESKRRFVNSFPNSMKFFTERPAAVDVDRIFPVLPVFGLPQINPVMGSRSVVADIMRLTDTLQNLFFSESRELCPVHEKELVAMSIAQQLNIQLQSKLNTGIFHLLVNPQEFVRIFGEDFLPARSYNAKKKSVDVFQRDDDLWEVLRFKSENMESFEKKWHELKLSQFPLDYKVFGPEMKKPQTLRFQFKKTCPDCDFESHPAGVLAAFSPYSALGACSSCQGYGANLVYDEKKIINKDLSILEGGLLLLKYAPFQFAFDELLKISKRKKYSLDIPLKKLPRDFFDLLENGEGHYPGYKELKSYLESKKYKPSVRIYIRNLQKEIPCKVCSSSRVNQNVHHFKIAIGGRNWGLDQIMNLSVEEALILFKHKNIRPLSHQARLYQDIIEKLKIASEMGLNHLSLLRKAKTLSAGEYQRLLLIKYLSFKGVDSLFVLDEPSLGLGLHELKKLLESLKSIIAQGNTVVLIDHSDFLQENSDHLIVMGPSSGKNGGEIIFQGKPEKYFNQKQHTAWEKRVRKKKPHQFLEVFGPEIYGKVYPDYKFPLEELVWVTGASGSGKTANLIKIMANTLYYKIHQEWLDEVEFKVKSIKSPLKFDDVIIVSSELNRFTSRSSVGTITELASIIRKHFLKLPISKSMGLKEGHFSSNSELGMCSKCEGKGSITIEMQYLEDIVLDCEDCKGLKIKPLYAQISDGKMTVAEAYNLPLSQVLERIELTPKYRRIWDYLKILNLDYLSLDRGLNSLSGGEKQRIYLLSKLMKSIQDSLLIFENLSFGLSVTELKMLGTFLQDLIQLNNTILVIDSSPHFKYLASHHLHFDKEVIKLIKLDQ